MLMGLSSTRRAIVLLGGVAESVGFGGGDSLLILDGEVLLLGFRGIESK